jgi:cation transport regulator ChaC
MNKDSLSKTVSDISSLTPARIYGFRRQYSKHDTIEGWRDIVGHAPYCALDVLQDNDKKSAINGVIFSVTEAELALLQAREDGYTQHETIAYDYITNEPIGTCIVFMCGQQKGKYDSENPVQKEYNTICETGAQSFGQDFYREFMATTKS